MSVMTPPSSPTPMSSDERRQFIRETSAKSYRRRALYSRLYLLSLSVALLIAFIPLASILQNVVGHGIHYITWHYLTSSQQLPSLVNPNDIGGIGNALAGTAVVDFIAVLISVPTAIVLAMAMFELRNRWVSAVRGAMETFIGLPSIVFGVFTYVALVLTTHQYHAYFGSLALCFIMIPVMTINALAALQSVPDTLIEAGLSLGSRPSRVMFNVILPAARPRIFTGIFLAFSRAVGETAPILFVIGASDLVSFNPGKQATTLPSLMYDYLTGSYPSLRESCWGIALVLMAAVLFFNVLSRIFVARSNRS